VSDAASFGRIDELLADVGLADAADRAVGGYSRGMRQRLGLADALVKDPEILILDEPTVNIDPEGVREILALVRRLRDERGVTVLVSSHLLNQVQAVCDRVGIFVDGRLRAQGSVDALVTEVDRRWTIELGAVGDPTAVAEAVRGVGGVHALRSEAGNLVVDADADVRAELLAAAQAAGARVHHLARRSADLDAVYPPWFGRHDDARVAG
jgi:ABC-2 type transport system ATP-binding protein